MSSNETKSGANRDSDGKQNSSEHQRHQLSDEWPDLSSHKMPPKNPSMNIHSDNGADVRGHGLESRQPQANVSSIPSPQSSPSKSTPKSRNKKRNEAKRRNMNIKKQIPPSPSSANVGNDNNIKVSDNQSDEIQPSHHSLFENRQIDAVSNQQTQTNSIESDKPLHRDDNSCSSKHQPDSKPQSISSLQQQNQSLTEPKTDNGHQAKRCDPGVGANDAAQPSRNHHDSSSWRRAQRENRDLKDKIKHRDAQLQSMSEKLKYQITKIEELEASLVNTTKTCNQFEKLLQQELSSRTRLEAENENLNQTIVRLKCQLGIHEKEKAVNSELIRVLNATLMERETEVSILKLKMTRLQTNSCSAVPLNSGVSGVSSIKQDPCKTYSSSGRSNSEFCRNSYIRSYMVAEALSARSSTSQLHSNDRDASVWATVPEELTPSKRPLMLERNFQSIYNEPKHGFQGHNGLTSLDDNSSSPLVRDRRYRTLPRNMSNPTKELSTETARERVQQSNVQDVSQTSNTKQQANCLVTNLDDSNNTSHSSSNKTSDLANQSFVSIKLVQEKDEAPKDQEKVVVSANRIQMKLGGKHEAATCGEITDHSHYSTESNTYSKHVIPDIENSSNQEDTPEKNPSTPVKISQGIKKIFGKIMRNDSITDSQSKTELRSIQTSNASDESPFQRGATRSTLIGPPSNIRAQLGSTSRNIDFKTEKPFAEWNTDMLVDWLTMIGLSMYANQCRRWVKCGAHIMNATPTEVDRGLGITNHLHRKKLRLAISELNGDCDKITKAAAKLDYLWVARWLDDIGLPQHKEAFINGRVDGRVLNYLTVEDLVSMGIKSVLHHSSIRCGIKVLRSINFDLQLLRRRATAEEIDLMTTMKQKLDDSIPSNSVGFKKIFEETRTSQEIDVPLWTCHRTMEWLRMIDFAEFAPNLRGSGVHGGLIMYEDGFNVDTMCSLLSIPVSRTLLRRHLSTFFELLIGNEVNQRKILHKNSQLNQQMNPLAELKRPRKSPVWLSRLKGSKVAHDNTMDEYLCPMYPVEPQIMKSPAKKPESNHRENLPRIPESVNV